MPLHCWGSLVNVLGLFFLLHFATSLFSRRADGQLGYTMRKAAGAALDVRRTTPHRMLLGSRHGCIPACTPWTPSHPLQRHLWVTGSLPACTWVVRREGGRLTGLHNPVKFAPPMPSPTLFHSRETSTWVSPSVGKTWEDLWFTLV